MALGSMSFQHGIKKAKESKKERLLEREGVLIYAVFVMSMEFDPSCISETGERRPYSL
jgi:hypothetical protein